MKKLQIDHCIDRDAPVWLSRSLLAAGAAALAAAAVCRRGSAAALTVLLAAVCLSQWYLTRRRGCLTLAGRCLLVCTVLAADTAALLSGGTAVMWPWLCALPAFAPLLLGLHWGGGAAAAFLLICAALGPEPEFLVTYTAFFLLGLTLERMWHSTLSKLERRLKEAEKFSQTDGLTGLYNRRWYNELLKGRNSQPEYRRRYAILLIDVDELKALNDSFGHLFGDEVLTKVSAAIADAVGDGGILCRWGGDEFLGQVRAASEQEALALAETIRKNVEQLSFALPDGYQLSITVSIGVVYVPLPGEIYSTELFSIADQALYEAKSCGRNCVRSRTLRHPET